MRMRGRFECLLNVLERHRLAGDERASLGIAEPGETPKLGACGLGSPPGS